jgi:two-component system, NarL family, sensor histidine kinase UhpB
MSLRAKINLIVGAITLLFVIAVLMLHVNDMRVSVSEEVVAAHRVASQLLSRTARGYADNSTAVMQRFMQGTGRVRATDITLLDASGQVLYRSPPSRYKAGRDAPAWFVSLVAPQPIEQSIALADGRLVVRSNATRAALDAWDALFDLVATALVLLVAVNALVFWIVGRTVRPFGRIVEALNALEAGRFDTALPPLPGTEARAIGRAFNRMLAALQANLETERRALRAERELSDSRELGRWVDQRLESERRSIARELHDEFGQSVTAIRSMALSIAQRVQAHDAEAEQAARLIATESSRLYDAMHGLIPRLAPLVLDTLGLQEALADLVARTRSSHAGTAIELVVELGSARVEGELALALYRAAQEGITNALRHGEAHHLRLSLMATDHGVRLDLHDDGRGLPAEGIRREGHHGLRWLAERVEGLGGRFEVASVAPHGVHLQIALPLTAVAA